MDILITGGAGYIGTTLVPMLLEQGHSVTVYDSLMFKNGGRLLPFSRSGKFSFIRGDIRETSKLQKAVEGKDAVIHLAALVGFPLCRKLGDREAVSVNTDATKALADMLTKDQYLLFGSTGSNYGHVDGICTEETPLNPLTAYGVTKTDAEKIVMAREQSTAFRFATAFGVSPRLRLDLLVNDLTYKAVTEGYAVIYEAHAQRTFIHVHDMARSFLFALENQDKMASNVYNVGSDKMNYSKREVCEHIAAQLPETYFNFADVKEDPDKRDYVVSYTKLKSLGFDVEVSLEQGIKELISIVPMVQIESDYHNVYR